MYKIGYTTGVFDLFHIGHLNILRQAKENCEFLIVGVCTDELVRELKGKLPLIPFSQRIEIVKSVRYVDQVVPEVTLDKLEAWNKLHYDVLFKGSDAQRRPVYREIEQYLSDVGVDVHYFPHTDGVSSSELKKRISL